MASGTAFIRTVEWNMLDKKRFYPYSMLSSFTVRCCLYPLTLIRTRLQMQHQNDLYRGTFDAYRKILRYEGPRGLYRGFWISAFQVVSGVTYVTTYEGVRHLLDNKGVKNTKLKAFIGGSCASVVGQTIIVPFDVISQHLMLLGLANVSGKKLMAGLDQNPLAVNVNQTKSRLALDVTRTIYARDGLRGFYRGYIASLCTYVPSSASWWTFYHVYQETGASLLPSVFPHTLIQCLAAVSSGCTTSLLTNPLDLIRARVQVQRRTVPNTVRFLWRTERWSIFTKGLTARMTSSSIYSLAVIFGYETVKKISVYEQFKDRILW